jgi:hypothetical protein
MPTLIVAMVVMVIAGVTSLQARNERIPPPPILISGGGLPGGGEDPWLPDDPYSGGGGGGGYDNNHDYGYPTSGPPGGSGVNTQGDGGWDWWNNSDFWGWGSGWWRYPDPDPSDLGAGTGDGIGSYDHDRALEDCRIIVAGGNDNRCLCMLQVTRDEQGKIVWRDKVARCSKHDPGDVSCRNLNPGDICWHQ